MSPAVAELSLPAGRHSFGLRRLAVLEAVRGSYDQAVAAVEGRCGKVLGKRQAEQLVVAAAMDVDDFYQCTIPLPSTTSTTLVMQVDGKGVVMRPEALRPATLKAHLNSRRAQRTRLAPGEKPHRKRMATLACIFDADPAPRRPHDVIAPPEGRNSLARIPRPGPRAHRKWLTASLLHPPEQVIAAAFDQATARDRDHLRDWVVLVDGACHQLGLSGGPPLIRNSWILVQDVADVRAAGVAADDVRLTLAPAEEAAGLGGEFGLAPGLMVLEQAVREVGVDQFVGVQLGRVRGQEVQLDVIGMGSEPVADLPGTVGGVPVDTVIDSWRVCLIGWQFIGSATWRSATSMVA